MTIDELVDKCEEIEKTEEYQACIRKKMKNLSSAEKETRESFKEYHDERLGRTYYFVQEVKRQTTSSLLD